jgi:lysophospholipase L1-like esterase
MSRSILISLSIVAIAVLVVVAAIVITVTRKEPTPAAEATAHPTASATATAAASATGPKVAFYGDSYTLGTGASDPSKRWSTVICAERNWQEFNPSVNGLGFINNREADHVDEPGEVIADNPDIVFITMGLNDNFSFDTAAPQIKKQITTDFTRLKTALPKARFIVVEPFWYTDDRPESLGIISGWVKDAAGAIGADYIPDASHWIEHHPEWMYSDGLHPNDKGYAEMAVRMDAALKNLGL